MTTSPGTWSPSSRYGKVAEPGGDDDTLAIKALNRKIATDRRVSASLVPIGDGIHMVYKH